MFAFLDIYPWALPVAIFFGRICDVSLSTLRIVFIARGERLLSAVVGFCEVFIWVVIISQVLSRTSEMVSFVAYAAGFSAGTYIGLSIEQRLAMGFLKYRVFTLLKGTDLLKLLNKEGFGSTLVHGEGVVSEIDIIETVINRNDAGKVEKIIKDFDPKAFCLVEDIRAKQLGIFSKRQALLQR